MKTSMISLLLTLLCVIPAFADGYKTELDIPYSAKQDAYSKERLKLDVMYPENGKDCPVVVWFHGGGLTGGNKHLPEELRDAGYVVIAPNYRLCKLNLASQIVHKNPLKVETLHLQRMETTIKLLFLR